MDITKFFSDVCSKRERMMSSIFELAFNEVPFERNPIGWAEGQKNPATFPIDEISFSLKDGTTCSLRDDELNKALKMGPAQGLPEVVEKLREMQNHWHSPPNDSWDVIVLNGSQDGLWRIFEAFVNNGDSVMIQMPVYFGVIGAIHSLSPDLISIRQDSDGIIPEEVENVCEEMIRLKKPIPKMLYVNPTGANPTGSVLTNDRKKKIYELSRKYDFLIMEDDACFFLHFLDRQPSSFLSMDIDGRVIRLDSFSKIISAGLRFGFVTAHKHLIDRLIIHVDNTVMHTSNVSQMFVYKLFENWSFERFDRHFGEIQKFYRHKRDMMLQAAEKHLTGLAEWSVPEGGMFLWIKVTATDNILNLAMNKFMSNGVFVIPGNAFNYDETKPEQHLRLCYSFATAESLERGMSIIGEIIRQQSEPKNIRID